MWEKQTIRMRVRTLLMVIHILQWNARSLIANGQEFKKYVYKLQTLPDVICVQESWLKPHLDFVIPGFSSIRYDRVSNQNGGGCVTFLKDGLAYRVVPSPEDKEYVTIMRTTLDYGCIICSSSKNVIT